MYMTVGQLKKLIRTLPDDTVFLLPGEFNRPNSLMRPERGHLTYAKATVEPVWVQQWLKFNTYRDFMSNPETDKSFRRQMLVVRKDT